MAAGRLPKPGTELGPCEGACHHLDCAKLREMAETECFVCHELIGYDTPFFKGEVHGTLVHELCYYDLLESEGIEHDGD